MSKLLEHSHVLTATNTFNNNDHQLLLQEFEILKQTENGWRECIQYLMNTTQLQNEHTTFLFLTALEYYIKNRYKSAEPSDQIIMKQFMSMWLQHRMNEKVFISRKAAQIFALVAVIDFPNKWKTFFQDLIETCKWNDLNADFYLKVLLAIDTEVVDREIPHTLEEANIATYFKDAIRDICVNDLVESWFILLKEYSNRNVQITCQTLEVIGAYISWIDINLIVNTRFIEYFNYSFAQIDLKEATCSCLEEIINKGMEPIAKLKLIDYLWLNVIFKFASNLTNEDDCDYLLKFGKLINAMGSNLAEGWHKLSKKDPTSASIIFTALEDKITFVLLLLSHSDDDISESVSDYCQNYIILLKHIKIQNEIQKKHIEGILKITIQKTKYDTSYNFDNEGEDEAMFLEYRKDIKLVFDAITQLDSDFVLNTVKILVLDTTANWRAKQFYDIENSLYLLHALGEAIPSSQGNYFAHRNNKSEILSEMLRNIISSNLVYHEHRIVKLQYFENIVRYDKFFQQANDLVETAIDHFIGPNGLHHCDVKVRSRVTYLFTRFTKDLKHLVNAYVEKILNTIQDLLIIWDPSLTIDEINQKLNFSDDQLFLYETISILIVTCNLDLNLKSQLMKSLLSPIMNSFFNLLNKYLVTVDENEKLILAKCLNNEMLVASRTSKGFSNAVKVKDCQCTELFLQLLQQFLPALNIQTHKNLINAGVRQYLHRMVVCLDNEIFEYLPLSIESFVNNSDAKDLNDFIPLLTQIIAKFKQQIFNFLQKIFMQICNNILNVLFSNLASNDVHVVQEATVLQKSYYQFLLAIINNELINVIIYQDADNVFRIFNTVIQGSSICSSET